MHWLFRSASEGTAAIEGGATRVASLLDVFCGKAGKMVKEKSGEINNPWINHMHNPRSDPYSELFHMFFSAILPVICNNRLERKFNLFI